MVSCRVLCATLREATGSRRAAKLTLQLSVYAPPAPTSGGPETNSPLPHLLRVKSGQGGASVRLSPRSRAAALLARGHGVAEEESPFWISAVLRLRAVFATGVLFDGRVPLDQPCVGGLVRIDQAPNQLSCCVGHGNTPFEPTLCAVKLLTRSHFLKSNNCPADGRTWVPFQDQCYHFVHGEEDKIKSYTFERAKTLCRGFELLTVQSAAENHFVIIYSPEVWRGKVNVWLGMYYDTDSEDMRWFGDESPVGFTNWEDSSSPSDMVPLDTCVALHSNTGRWENVSCLDEVENGVICETAQKEEEGKQRPNALLSALVILSVVAIMGISAVIWFLHQKNNLGSTIFTAFEYHPPFRVLDTDQSCLVEAEETDSVP
ncbi:putative CD302 antigen [Scophthalmus maximus]|uniref:Putative CD302 antigen n=1 Tax=Scophthalmus maximus TaxID=52904 RepID=A0A2U9CDU3_SCOMX|nr:putative CD302 antigen [Scophthalmus maximus]